MQEFTYSKKAASLRGRMTMLMVALLFDMVQVAVLALILHGLWRWMVIGAGVLFMAVAYALVTEPGRTRHRLSPEFLDLAYGRFRLRIPRGAITSVAPYLAGLPAAIRSAPSARYLPDDDTLYLAADSRRLVVMTLGQPLEGRTLRQGLFQCTRVVLTLDEPERFLEAVAAPRQGAPSGHVAAAGAPGQDARDATAGARVRGGRSLGGTSPDGASLAAGAAIRLVGLQRRFEEFVAVGGIDLTAEPGEVLAFLGSNGAGKTTTIKMMVGLLRPTAGQVWIGGHDVWAEGAAARRQLGYVPDVPLLYESLTAREFLWLVAGLYDLPKAEGRSRTEELLTMLQMGRWGDHQIRHFSLGMKRKMAIAAALVHRPRVLLLDEVTNGLDPRAAREVKDFIRTAAAEGTTVFLTTHMLDVAQELADRIALIHRGELRAVGTLADLRGQAGLPGADLEALFLALTEEDGPHGEAIE